MDKNYITLFGDAMELLCGGSRPSDELLEGWLDKTQYDDTLEVFAETHGPAWSQGLLLIEAAQLLADNPREIKMVV